MTRSIYTDNGVKFIEDSETLSGYTEISKLSLSLIPQGAISKIIGKKDGRFISKVLSSDTTITFEEPMNPNDTLYVPASMEYIIIGGNVSDYIYNVIRAVNSSVAVDYEINTLFVIIGQTNDGYIEFKVNNGTDTIPSMSIKEIKIDITNVDELSRYGDLVGINVSDVINNNDFIYGNNEYGLWIGAPIVNGERTFYLGISEAHGLIIKGNGKALDISANSTVTDLNGQITTNTSNITQNATTISLNVSRTTTPYTNDLGVPYTDENGTLYETTIKNNITSANERITSNSANITINADSITSNVNSIIINGLNVSSNTSNITQNATSIVSNVNSIISNGTDITTNTSNITQNANDITLKVSSIDYDGATIVSKINIESSTISIDSKNINITGTTTFANGLDLAGNLNNGTTTIDGGIITTKTIIADNINVINLSSLATDLGIVTAGSIVIGTTNMFWLNDNADGSLAIGGTVKSAAPFQVDAAGNLTALNGNFTGTINSGSTVVGSTIIGGKLQTAASGERIEIDSIDSSFNIYDDLDNLAFTLKAYPSTYNVMNRIFNRGYELALFTVDGNLGNSIFDLSSYGSAIYTIESINPVTFEMGKMRIRVEPVNGFNGFEFTGYSASPTYDTNLYRDNAGILKTDGTFTCASLNSGAITGSGSISTTGTLLTGQSSSNGAGYWSLGKVIGSAGGLLDTGTYVEVRIDGTLMKLAVLQ